MRSLPHPRTVAVAALLALTAGAAADEATPQKPPLTKEEERAKFHGRRTGMEPGPRLAGYARRLEMERASPLGGLAFRSVGPEVQGGRIVDIEMPSLRPDSLIIAYASGGLWRSDNRGGSWTPLFDHESTITIGDVALGDGEGRTIYVGTGENNSSRTSYAGTGVFKSTDAGRTWKNVGLADSHHIGRVLVDARDPRIVYVAALGHLYTESSERGVYRSADGGETWTRTLFVDDRTGAVDLVQDTQHPEVLYAATWEKARSARNFLESGPGSGVWKSTDRGLTWHRLAGGLPRGATVGRIGLALAASRPSTVYAVVDNQALRPETEPFDEDTPSGELTPRRLRKLDAEDLGRLEDPVLARFLKRYEFPKTLKVAALKKALKAGTITVADLIAYVQDANRDLFEREVIGSEVYRSDDGGGSWRRTHDKPIDKVFYSYGYYFARIAVDPTDPERIYFGGVPMLGSRDGGKTWTGLDQRGVHVDHHVLQVDPRAPNRVALGNDGGLNLSYDHGHTWTRVSNLPVGQFTTLALDNATPYNILGGLQDNGVMRGPSTYKPGKSDPNAWRPILGGDGSAVVVDPKDDGIVYTAFQFGHAYRLALKGGGRDKIRPRHELSPTKKEKPYRYNWVTPFILSPHSRDILYYGANRVFRSLDRGDTWTAISEDLTSNPEQGDVPFGTITSLSESPKRFGVLYAGTDDGKVWVTRDGGATWTDVTAGLAAGRWVTRVLASAHDEGTVYVSQNGYRDDDFAAHVFRSADYGRTWESLTAGLPAEPVNTVREDPKDKDLLYVGTDMGAFVSLDRGKAWIALTGGLPHVPVHDLAVHPREGDLVLATHGQSVYLAEAAPLRALTPEVMGKPLHAFKAKKAPGDWGRGYGEHPWITWPNDPATVRIAYWSSLKAGAPVGLTVKDENGNPWKELTDTSRPGYNEVVYDLSAEPKLADAAEAAARAKAAEKKAAADKEKDKDKAKGTDADAKDKKEAAPASPAPPAEDEEPDEEAADKTDGGRPLLDAELQNLLADPLRSTRRRYLPPGKYTVELRSGTATSTTTLEVKPPKADQGGDDDEAGGEPEE